MGRRGQRDLPRKVRDVTETLARPAAAGARASRIQRARRVPRRLSPRACARRARPSLARCSRRFPASRWCRWPEPDICCGSAGIFNLVQPEMAAALGHRKAAHIADAGVDMVVTSNPGCILQIRAALRSTATRSLPQVIHIVELLDRAIRSRLKPDPTLVRPLRSLRPLLASASCTMEAASMIEIYDTTLRDGTQGEGITFSVADKLRIAERLDAFGVHYIEGGWPGSNPQGHRVLRAGEAPHVPPRAAGGVRLDAPQGHRASTADDQVRLLLDAATPVVTIFGKTWLLHVREVLQTTPEENLAMIARHRALPEGARQVRRLRRRARLRRLQGRPRSTRSRPGRRPSAAGADVVTLCDTNGGSLPAEIAEHHALRARAPDGAARHPHARRHRPRRRQRAGLASTPARRTSRARSTATASAPATAT